ncbi:MAG: Crp/Fnr family transcriptional regulator [Bacteroidota bacterium]
MDLFDIIDFEKLKALYKFGRALHLKDIQTLIKSAHKRSFSQGDYLIQEGDTKREVFLIRRGLIRAFSLNDKGDEITTSLRWENQIVASTDILLFNEPARQYIQALEPCEMLSIDFDLLQSIVSQNPKLEANRKHLLRAELKRAYHRINTFVLLSPEERYIEFVHANPDILNRVPNKYIANILGITPVSLSRIRKRIAAKRK